MRVHIPGPSRTKDRPTSVDLIRLGLAIRQGAGGGGGGGDYSREAIVIILNISV